MNINRDYLIKLSLAKTGASRGKIEANNILFYTSDRYTQNIFLVADTDITDLDKIELLFSIDNQEHRATGTRLDDKTVLFNLNYQDLQTPGTYQAAILLAKDDEVLTSQIFNFTVEANLLREGE